VAVADAYQGKGVGSNLLRMLATMSLAAGEPNWRCDVLADNDAPLRLLATVGAVELGTVSGGVRSVLVHLDPERLLGTTVVI
jgi:ribosomal protein S18 acetylase RimI-like enzyme